MLLLLRHLEVAVPKTQCYGQQDVALAASALASLPAFAAHIRAQYGPFSAVHSSPLQRCWQLAQALCPQPVAESALIEMDFGRWQGQSWDAISRHEVNAWGADLLHHAPGGGESLHQLAGRVLPCLTLLRQWAAEQSQPLLVVSHGGPIRLALAAARGLPLEAAARIEVTLGGVYAWGSQ